VTPVTKQNAARTGAKSAIPSSNQRHKKHRKKELTEQTAAGPSNRRQQQLLYGYSSKNFWMGRKEAGDRLERKSRLREGAPAGLEKATPPWGLEGAPLAVEKRVVRASRGAVQCRRSAPRARTAPA
jgi:hypothetical protein